MEASVISDQEYVDALRVMDSSGRGETIINALERNILGELSEEEDFLEVGVGTGIVTNAISKNFKRTSIVEINLDLMTHINFLPEMVFHESVVNVKLPVGRYDLVLCSHVFYRFSIEEITQAVLRLRAGLKRTGVLAIVMTAPRNTYHELCSFFDTNYTNSGHIHKVLNDLGVSYKSISEADRYICERREKFSALCRFFIAMDCDPAQTGSVRRLDGNQFLEDFLLRSRKDKGYEIVVEHDLLWLTGAD
ncbi:methyltransferase domain-containing protein [Paraburkholderia youngii]|uniref:methyltransferase domain-containing protein n=1 Tax=Paraburkholderia youngii TaxID=2782701 RepID=UPI00159245B6|nr:class I SAM-dependent methyltransferase [Paraburkholderia youngii]NUX59092.1 class I SAM-dependent methyltransferase [Paraburkholderia youngii]